ncbi:MAG: type II secretion system F family protein [Pirellulaceae bacterium]|nr:type II secretion system F family protein [Pirellulaceae bacterium]
MKTTLPSLTAKPNRAPAVGATAKSALYTGGRASTVARSGTTWNSSPNGISTATVAQLAGRINNLGSRNRAAAHKPLRIRELLTIVTQLSIMLRSGVDLADAVRSIATRSKRESIRQAMAAVYSSLENGCRLSDALQAQQRQFGALMVASVAAGEASGTLSDVLARVTQVLNDELRMRNSIRSALSYPLILTAVTSFVLAAMIFFVLPQFGDIYASAGARTPAMTRMLLDASELARSYWWLLLAAAGMVAASVWRYFASSNGRLVVDRVLLNTPLLRSICGPLISGRVFRLQGAMLSSGVPMVDALQLTRECVSNQCFKHMLDHVESTVINGEGVAVALRKYPFVPDEATDMIATAESNGQLASVLQTVGEFYESQGEQNLRDTIKFAEPAIIIGMGLMIGAIVLAVMLPMLDLSTAAQA